MTTWQLDLSKPVVADSPTISEYIAKYTYWPKQYNLLLLDKISIFLGDLYDVYLFMNGDTMFIYLFILSMKIRTLLLKITNQILQYLFLAIYPTSPSEHANDKIGMPSCGYIVEKILQYLVFGFCLHIYHQGSQVMTSEIRGIK